MKCECDTSQAWHKVARVVQGRAVHEPDQQCQLVWGTCAVLSALEPQATHLLKAVLLESRQAEAGVDLQGGGSGSTACRPATLRACVLFAAAHLLFRQLLQQLGNNRGVRRVRVLLSVGHGCVFRLCGCGTASESVVKENNSETRQKTAHLLQTSRRLEERRNSAAAWMEPTSPHDAELSHLFFALHAFVGEAMAQKGR